MTDTPEPPPPAAEPPATAADPLHDLIDQLQVEPLERNLFRGRSVVLVGERVFGGQVLGQAVMAAARTVEEGRALHSLHAYFLRPGDARHPIVYEVERIRDGGSFATRRVVAIQHGRPIFNFAASFQAAETGVDHQRAMPEAASPESLQSETELRAALRDKLPGKVRVALARERAIEIRPVQPDDLMPSAPREPVSDYWLRARGPLPDDFALHQAMLAYASDFGLLRTAMLPHGLHFMQPDLQVASLDHAMWFHRPFRMDDWLLYKTDSPSASGARGFCRGSLHARDGRLVASVAQEGLIRVRSVT